MPRCTRKGCGKEYTTEKNDTCVYHSGAPVFHEGLKSWSCCSDVNKPVLDFDDFMKIPGCTQIDHHVTEAVKTEEPPKPAPNTNITMTKSSGGKEEYASGSAPQSVSKPSSAAPAPAPIVEEEDDLDAPVQPGATCRRKGCGTKFVSNEVNRNGDGEGTVCTYHPSVPIFHEGSKGYLCCKRRVLEFEEFLKIEGCKKGRHVFVPRVTSTQAEEMVKCRIDHYQTRDQVHVSVFAKQADKERSTVTFDESQVALDLYLPGAKRFSHTIVLFGPIDPTASTFTFLGTKVELHLRKQDGRSWTVLEKTDRDLGNIALTFGVGGRTGTIGGKEIVLDESNKARAT